MSFEKALNFVLEHEGGFSQDAADPGNWTGGEVGKGRLLGTKYGISAASFPILDIPNLTIEDAAKHYRLYWNEVKGDELPEPWGMMLFDACVNQGAARAVRTLQKTLRVTVDGVMGPETIGELRGASSESIDLYLADRLIAYTQTANFDTYGRGWFRRVVSLARSV